MNSYLSLLWVTWETKECSMEVYTHFKTEVFYHYIESVRINDILVNFLSYTIF